MVIQKNLLMLKLQKDINKQIENFMEVHEVNLKLEVEDTWDGKKIKIWLR